ncbi:MAG: metallophosphoesterase [Bryobacteraceae bacterium]|jgi:3',5'-cyclic AMP phosphodiesterase CpdA
MKKTVPLLALAAIAAVIAFRGVAAAPAAGQAKTAQPAATQLTAPPTLVHERVVGGPYAVNVGPRTATVMWVVESGEASLGSAPGKKDKTEPILHAEKATFAGLEAGRKYYYQSFAGAGGRGSFETPPAAGTGAQFEFVVYGDTRTRHDVHRTVIAAILKYAHPDFAMHTGDLVADGDDLSLWPIFFDIESPLLRQVAFYPALGNHERDSKNYGDLLDAPPYYSFDWGSAHFTVINSDIANVGRTKAERDAFWAEQTRWLEADLQASQKADSRFFFAHHPPMTAVRSRQGDNPHMTALEPMFEKYKLTAGFFGHDHNYQHYLLNGIHYFITGGGGAPLYDVDLPPAGITKKVASTENFVVVQVNGKKAHVQAFKPNGETLDVADLGQ